MTDLVSLSIRALAAQVAQGTLSAEAVARAYLERVEALEPSLHAWQYFDADAVLTQARQLDRGGHSCGMLAGVPLGVKDLMDTADMPTTYGSPIYAGHRPATDAACVGAARAAGAVVFGKTVTTEFATFKPGPTVNPRSLGLATVHTPGGSSSGSAAAVAAGMVPVAFGTQTAASIIRPAAFCGIVGYKPTFGTLPAAGVKSLAPSLDTIGVLTRSVDDAAFVVGALARRNFVAELPTRLRVGVFLTPHRARADADTRRAIADASRLLEQAGAVLGDAKLGTIGEALTPAQIAIMAYEAAAAFAPEWRLKREGLSAPFRELLNAGAEINGETYAEMQQIAEQGRAATAALFDQFDVLLAPSALGEAPAGLDATGDPLFSRMWTLLGNPCVNVPVGVGVNGLPVGVTVIGPRWRDQQALSVAALLERLVGQQQN